MMKSLGRPIAFMVGLTALTCWLFVKSRQTGHDSYDNVSQLLTLISRLDVELNAEVLKLEFELHKNYDRLMKLEKSFSECTSQLDAYNAFAFGRDLQDRQRLLEPIARKQELVTDFKALHAVLENSVSIFSRASQQFDRWLSRNPTTSHACEDLLHLERAAMELVLKASPDSLKQVEQGIAWLHQLDLNADPVADRIRNISVAHARNLLKAKPQMDRLLSELDQLNVPAAIEAMQSNAMQMFTSKNQRAAGYQMQLLCATLLLICYGGYSIQRIGRYVVAIRQANEMLEDRVRLRTRELEAKTEVLRSNGRFLASVLDAMDAKICILDADGTINATNAAWRQTAEDKSVNSGENYLNAFPNDRRTNFGSPEVVAAIDSLKTNEARAAVVEFACASACDGEPGGTQHYIQARVSRMMPQGSHKSLGFVVALIDITDQVRAQVEKDKLNQQLASAHGESARLLSAISSALIAFDQVGVVSRWNAVAEKLFGISAEDAIGRSLTELPICWEDAEQFRAFFEANRFVENARLEAGLYRADQGTGVVSLTLHPLLIDGLPSGGLMLADDITGHKLLEQQLQQAQKLESVGQLAAGVAHEINTPMQYVGDNIHFVQASLQKLEPVMKLLDMLQSKDPVCDVTLESIAASLHKVNVKRLIEHLPGAVRDAHQGVQNVTRIVYAMKEFSHPGSDKPSLVNINQALESTVVVSRSEWKYIAELETDLTDACPNVLGYAHELQQVFLNLLVNAAHAIETRKQSDQQLRGQLRVTTKCVDDRCLISIQDNGCGIPRSIRNRVYDPFFTTKEVGKGTGQGLAIAHQVIVNKHQGKLWFESEPNVGTTFTIELPLEASMAILP